MFGAKREMVARFNKEDVHLNQNRADGALVIFTLKKELDLIMLFIYVIYLFIKIYMKLFLQES